MKLSTKVVRYIRQNIKELNDEQINSEIITINSLNSGNCDWLEFRLKPALLDVLTNELQLRQDKNEST